MAKRTCEIGALGRGAGLWGWVIHAPRCNMEYRGNAYRSENAAIRAALREAEASNLTVTKVLKRTPGG